MAVIRDPNPNEEVAILLQQNERIPNVGLGLREREARSNPSYI